VTTSTSHPYAQELRASGTDLTYLDRMPVRFRRNSKCWMIPAAWARAATLLSRSWKAQRFERTIHPGNSCVATAGQFSLSWISWAAESVTKNRCEGWGNWTWEWFNYYCNCASVLVDLDKLDFWYRSNEGWKVTYGVELVVGNCFGSRRAEHEVINPDLLFPFGVFALNCSPSLKNEYFYGVL